MDCHDLEPHKHWADAFCGHFHDYLWGCRSYVDFLCRVWGLYVGILVIICGEAGEMLIIFCGVFGHFDS